MENKEIKESYINEEIGIEYKKVGDYFVPNIILEQKEKVILNKYGRARLRFLKENKKAEYTVMFMNGTLNNHIKEIQKIIEERLNSIINQFAKQENIKEELKENNQMEWVKSMNNIQNRAEEIIYNEIIYSQKIVIRVEKFSDNLIKKLAEKRYKIKKKYR